MAALDDRFDFHLSRTDVPKLDANGFQAGRRLFKRLWTVTVIPTGATVYIAKVEAADLASALEGAVEAGERQPIGR